MLPKKFPLIKLAKKLKDVENAVTITLRLVFPLIKLAKKLKASHGLPMRMATLSFPLIKLAKKLKDLEAKGLVVTATVSIN